MGVKIQLSKRSTALIIQYIDIIQRYHKQLASALSKDPSLSSVELDVLISWLNEEVETPIKNNYKTMQQIEFVSAALHAAFLDDLLHYFKGSNVINQPEKVKTSGYNKAKFVVLVIFGTLLAACQGFDSIATLLLVLSAPSIVTLLVGLAFSILSVSVFYMFELVQISKEFGVKLTEPKLLDVYLAQLDRIKSIRRIFDTYNLVTLSSNELAELELTMRMLQHRFNALTVASQQFCRGLNNTKIQASKTLFSVMAGVLYFGGGFFAGQSVAIFILGLFITSVSPTLLPIILFSLLVGFAALSFYWFVQRAG